MECLHPIRIKNPKQSWRDDAFIDVPCGKCASCMMRKRAAWHFRLKQEYKHCYNAFFVTLTYAENYLPRNSLGFPTFSKTDVQKFFKRLRKRCEPCKIRHFTVSEYGGQFGRPHYHSIIFNAPEQFDLWKVVASVWPFGRISVSSLTESRIGYVCNYMYGYFDMAERDPECDDESNNIFMLCSKRQGIGLDYLSDDVVTYHKQGLISYVQDGPIKQSMPRYYKDKIFDEKEKRVISQKTRLAMLSKQIEQYQKDMEIDKRLIEQGLPTLSEQRKRDYERRISRLSKKHKNNKKL